MMMRPARAVGAALVSLALVASACGGDDGDGTATEGTIREDVREGVREQLGAETEAELAEQPQSMEEWEELWAEERAATVARIQENGWGLSEDGATLTGPEGFEIDLSACPAGWVNDEGLTPSHIRIGHTTAQSGTLADYGNIARSLLSVFEYYNGQGGFTDSTGATRTLELLVRDDAYDPARTIPLVDELIDSERVFAMWTLGSPNTLRVYSRLNERCIPNPFVMSGHPAWGDPINNPWTTPLQLAYNTEAILWGEFIEQRLDDEFGGNVKVAGLVMNNDFGISYDASFRAWMAQSPNRDNIEYVTETIEPQEPILTNPMTTLAFAEPDVFIAMVAGTPCTQAITEAAQSGMTESVPYLFQPSVCKAASFVGRDAVGGDGSASDGWWIVGGGIKDLNSAAYDDDPFIEWGRELLTADGHDYMTSGSFGTGYLFAWPMVQSLLIAGELEGGLNRTNFVLAQRSMSMTHPYLLPGVGFGMDGNADAFYIEGSEMAQYDASAQAWVQRGGVINLEGRSGLCAWNASVGACQ